jgi:hypothetical protein
MDTQDLQDSDMDAVIKASFRNAPPPTAAQKLIARERLMRHARMQAVVMPYAAPILERVSLWTRFLRMLAGWHDVMWKQEFCYDRARHMPSRALANKWRCTHMENFLLLHPAF